MDKIQERYKVLMESLPDAVFILDAQGTFCVMNDSAARQVGGRPSDFIGKSLRDLFPPDLAGLFAAYVRQVIESRKGMVTLTQQPLRGGMRWHRTCIEPLLEPNGQVATALLIAKDITDQRDAEEARRQTEARYRTLVEQLPVITYTASMEPGAAVLFISPQVEELLGFTAEECRQHPELWSQQLHPQDRDRVLAEVDAARIGGRNFHAEYRLLSKDGRVKWFRDEARPVSLPGGHSRIYHGVLLDITEQISAREAARCTDRLLQQLFACSPIGMAIHDSRGRLVNVNRAAKDILGRVCQSFRQRQRLSIASR
jgi:PAS domain S-box-containing protein